MRFSVLAFAIVALMLGVCHCKKVHRPTPVATATYPQLVVPHSAAGIDGNPLHVNGIFPALTATADSAPKRSECGVGGLMPWADHLYMVSYLSVPNAGSGTGLYEITPDLATMRLVAPHNSTYANRIMHAPSNQIIIGAWAVDAERNVRAFNDLLHVRIGGVAMHLTDDRLIYMLSMDGPLYECDVDIMNCTQIFDLVTELNIPKSAGEQPHFKACHTMNGRLVVASNTFEEADLLGKQHGGRLAEWQGPGKPWVIIESTAFVEVTGRANFGKVIYAAGWDKRSSILMVYDGGDGAAPSSDIGWQRYRIPMASHAFDHLWQTEWPRIREVATERYLYDAHGTFFELSPLGWAGSSWGIRPIAQHLRVIPDFTSFRGFFVAGGNQVSSIFDNNLVTGQAQSGLWFGKVDDLWSWGKPKGWGGPWRYDNVTANVGSDAFLMTGYDHKTLHLTLHGGASSTAITVEIDYTGIAGHVGEAWSKYAEIKLTADTPYQFHVFPSGFSAHWVRLVSSANCNVTGYFHYS